ncbi:MAG TPA: SDR family NAD(P)-dependent oxidoreductase [Chitinophagales bacterium]|nr:SDR family NAD(P)-dependent oxidoreductase [Chitinophagales bacterium]
MAQTILVTGVSSSIGEELIHQLLITGFQVRATCSPNDDLSKWQKYTNQIQFLETHILDVTEVYQIVKDVDVVFHCDTIDEYQAVSYENRMKYNVEGTANIVNAMLYHGVEKIVFFSSLKSLLTVPNKVSDENSKAEINEWTTEYALSMLLAEREIWRGSVEGLKVNIVNCADILVKKTSSKNLYTDTIEKLQNGKVEIYPSNIQYVDVKDIAILSLKILKENHWNATWLALGGCVDRMQFYQLVANHLSLNWKSNMVTNSTVYFKITMDFIKSILFRKERTFRKANGQYLMSDFKFNNQLTTSTFDMQWNSLEQWLNQHPNSTQ